LRFWARRKVGAFLLAMGFPAWGGNNNKMTTTRKMETHDLTPKPKKRKAKPAPEKNGHQNGRDNGERPTERDTEPTDKVSSGNVEVRIWANPIPGGGYSYRFKFSQKGNWKLCYFDGDDGDDAVIAARKARRWILAHRWRTLFGFRR
jgi:hypothetical protein